MIYKIIPLLLLTACSSLKIRSTPPEAEVYIAKAEQKEAKLIGKTPLTKDIADLDDEVNSGTIAIEVRKKGFISKNFIIPNIGSGKLEIDTSLSPNFDADYKTINKIISKLFLAERYIKQKRLDKALKISEEVKSLNENIAAAYHISGTVYFLKKQFKKSRFEWARALDLDATNANAQNMLATLDKKLKE